ESAVPADHAAPQHLDRVPAHPQETRRPQPQQPALVWSDADAVGPPPPPQARDQLSPERLTPHSPPAVVTPQTPFATARAAPDRNRPSQPTTRRRSTSTVCPRTRRKHGGRSRSSRPSSGATRMRSARHHRRRPATSFRQSDSLLIRHPPL